jgi:indolepyruvate ferredoxin oxidoreductase
MARKSSLARVDGRFLKEEGREVFTGTELLVKGLLETRGGTHLWTGYPGSPVSGFFDAVELVRDLLKEKGIRAILSNNEALAGAMLNGSQMMGLRAAAVMKSVGLHVASDALALGNLAGAHPEGGALVIVGDDPWSESTQVPADSRFLGQHLYLPVLEPGTLQEVKDWIDLGFALSRESGCFVLFLLSTYQAEGGGTVLVRQNHFDSRFSVLHPVELDTSNVDYEKVLLPPRTGKKEKELAGRFRKLWEGARRLSVNQIVWPKGSSPSRDRHPLGILTGGLSFCYVCQALEELGVLGEIPILRYGITYPLDGSLLLEFAQGVEALVVVEERRPFLEQQAAWVLAQCPNAPSLWGKKFPFGLAGVPEVLGLNPSLVTERLGRLFGALASGAKGPRRWEEAKRRVEALERVQRPGRSVLARTPTFCPGCPHRDTASVLLEIKKAFKDSDYMWKRHRRGPVDLLFHGDTGCYTMLMFEPNQELMHNYSGMGLGGGTGLGIDPFVTNKQVVFMGDSTFFHSGLVAISNSVKNRQDVTYLILDNRTTAMTGHQATPGVEEDLMGERSFPQRIEAIVRAITREALAPVLRLSPGDRRRYRQILESVLLRDGVKVVIAEKECAITYQRKLARKEREEIAERGFLAKKRYIQVNTEVCEYCLECTLTTGCPGLSITETSFGPKIQTDLSFCVADGACAKLYACPAFEEVTLVRKRKGADSRRPWLGEELPVPNFVPPEEPWNLYLAGVGGMGVASLTAVIVRAGHREGYRVRFCQKTGLAIRNGGVYSHCTLWKSGQERAEPVLIPYGKADLILGLDLLEAARVLDPRACQWVASPERTVAIVNTAKNPTVRCLLGWEDFSTEELGSALRHHTRAERFVGWNLSELSEKEFGTKLLTNLVLLGVAFQRGEVPISLPSLQWAIGETFGARAHENWLAFQYGRYLAEHPPGTQEAPWAEGYKEVLKEKVRFLEARGSSGKELARILWRLASEAFSSFSLDDATLGDLVRRLYELLLWGGQDYARRYLELLRGVEAQDRKEKGCQATRAAIDSLFRVMAIKDELYVAELLTRPERYQKDRERYRVDADREDALVYRHFLCPEIRIFGWRRQLPMRVPHWVLRRLAECRWVRKAFRLHQEEEAFRDFYLDVVEKTLPFPKETQEQYEDWVAFLRLPLRIRGFRNLRRREVEKVREEVHAWVRRFQSGTLEEASNLSL